MDPREIREMSDDAILDAIEDQKLAMFNLRFQRATGQLEDTNAIRKVKRDLARLKTILRERQLAAQAAKEEGQNAE
jgi:large subunit ribosomal protein L29